MDVVDILVFFLRGVDNVKGLPRIGGASIDTFDTGKLLLCIT